MQYYYRYPSIYLFGCFVTPRSATMSADVVRRTELASSSFVDDQPLRVRVLSWNIDGLDQGNVVTRARAVVKTILKYVLTLDLALSLFYFALRFFVELSV